MRARREDQFPATAEPCAIAAASAHRRRIKRASFFGRSARSPKRSSFQQRKGSMGSLLIRIGHLSWLAIHTDPKAQFGSMNRFLRPINDARRRHCLHQREQRRNSFMCVTACHNSVWCRLFA